VGRFRANVKRAVHPTLEVVASTTLDPSRTVRTRAAGGGLARGPALRPDEGVPPGSENATVQAAVGGSTRVVSSRLFATSLLLLWAGVMHLGCVERKLLIRSDPPGGVALVDNRIVGVTPVTVPFTFYGARKVEVRWDTFLEDVPRFEPAEETRYVNPPWYQIFPIDFIFEFVWPFTISDERVFSFKLKRLAELDPDTADERESRIINRAETMRAKALRRDSEEESP
jgi:hypothetical protein